MITINQDKCIGCGLCEKECFRMSIDIDGGKAYWKNRNCTACGHCFAVCPIDAVTVEGYPDDTEIIDSFYGKIETSKLKELQKKRRSLRRFSTREVEKEIIEQVIDSARYSATGGNFQELSFTVIQDRMDDLRTWLWQDNLNSQYGGMFGKKYSEDETRRMIERMSAAEERITYKAPVCIAIKNDMEMYKNPQIQRYAGVDVGLACANMEIMANNLGLGIVYCGTATTICEKDKRIVELLNVNGEQSLMLVMMLGYPDEKQKFYRTPPRLKRDILWK